MGIKISVADDGIGIDEDKQRILFNPFEQGDTEITRNYGGTGLGLAISNSIIEQMGGELSVQSEAGKGSEFSFVVELPIGNGDIKSKAEKGNGKEQYDFKGKTIWKSTGLF